MSSGNVQSSYPAQQTQIKMSQNQNQPSEQVTGVMSKNSFFRKIFATKESCLEPHEG